MLSRAIFFLFFCAKSFVFSSALSSLNLSVSGGCPSFEDLAQSSVLDFDPTFQKYAGFDWYELAYYDVTQTRLCGCTKMRWSIESNSSRFVDIFSTQCPIYPKSLRRTWLVEMRGPIIAPARVEETAGGEFWFSEIAFPNWIIDILRDEQGNYQRSIQFQCREKRGEISFVGINFLSRSLENIEEQLDWFFERSLAIGLDKFGASRAEMSFVVQADCAHSNSEEARLN